MEETFVFMQFLTFFRESQFRKNFQKLLAAKVYSCKILQNILRMAIYEIL